MNFPGVRLTLVALASLLYSSAGTVAQRPAKASAPDVTPRIGILIPVGPPDYAVLLDEFHESARQTFGPFEFRVGKLEGVDTVLSLAPSDGVLARSLAAEEMVHHYNVRAFVYAGTSGGHLEPDQMHIGDIVLGAKHVDFSNFFMGKGLTIEKGAFTGMQPGMKHFDAFYADPTLLGYLACASKHVSESTSLPEWVNPKFKEIHPNIFYFGIQGTSTIWMADRDFIHKTMDIYHEIDEDGDWYSAFVATLYHVPFIEVSVISNSIFEFPETDRGHPERPNKNEPTPNVLAQRISNHIVLELLKNYGAQILATNYTDATRDPFPAAYYTAPMNPQSLLTGCATAGTK